MIDMYKMVWNCGLFIIAVPYVIANSALNVLTGIIMYILDKAGEFILNNFKVVGYEEE